jgi:hypothetical protein
MSVLGKRASHGATTNVSATQLVGAPYCSKATKGKYEGRSVVALRPLFSSEDRGNTYCPIMEWVMLSHW